MTVVIELMGETHVMPLFEYSLTLRVELHGVLLKCRESN